MKTNQAMQWLLRIGSIFFTFSAVMILYSIANGEQVFQAYHLFGLMIYLIPQIYFAWFYKFT